MKENAARLILASTSPRRRELVTRLDLPFEYLSVDVDESPHPAEAPEGLVRRLSLAKAHHGLEQAGPAALVVAADTVVSIDGQILGKPLDAGDAVRMLKLLRGRPHRVYTGLVVAGAGHTAPQLAETTVWMREYADDEIKDYVATGDPLDKAAAYAIQHPAFHPVDRIEGCYSNVMGLPLCRLYLALQDFGIAVPDPRRFLTSHLESDCPVARHILNGNS